MAATQSPDAPPEAARPMLAERGRQVPMRVAINLLTDDPENPSGAHWFWTRVIPEMAKRLESGEELHLLVSPKSRQSSSGLRAERLLHHLSVVERAAHAAHALRAPLLAAAAAAQPHRRLQHPDGARGEPLVVARHPHEDDARLHRARGDRAAAPRVPAAELSAHRAGRGGDHHQLPELALRDRAVPERRRAQAQADLRGGRPRPVQAGRRRRGSRACGVVRRHEAVRALRVVAVAVQEL